jgi:hypothetical protein
MGSRIGFVAAKGPALGLAVLVVAFVAAPRPVLSSMSGPEPGWDLLAPADVAAPAAPELAGFVRPIDAELNLLSELIPGAPREYRAGTHEGVDFAAPFGTPVLAAHSGVVARVDRDYVEWTARERAAALAAALKAQGTPAATLDRIRGRQIWIDHGAGLVTRYAHLASVEDLRIGDFVRAGERIGSVGSSGLPEGGPHLHFEIRLGGTYLGEGLTEDEVRYVLARAFSPLFVWRD